MEGLKWFGYILVSILGLCLAVGISFVLYFIGAFIGVIALGGFIVVLVACGIEEYFNPPSNRDS